METKKNDRDIIIITFKPYTCPKFRSISQIYIPSVLGELHTKYTKPCLYNEDRQ
jgi:hypothetical protein